jgi:acyl-CoA-binding protein
MMAREVRAISVIGDEGSGYRRAHGVIADQRGSERGHSWLQFAKADTSSGKVMADLKVKFEKAAEDVKKLSERPDNDTLLKLYALYKQGSEGDVSGAKPGFFDFVGTAKYEAWAKLKGMKPEEAMQKYTDLVKKLGG